ncbi:hypothetical protein V8G54_023811 [Vigna mungo]|uniref:Integrase catalytic domain-containing protein n=1 Tax=Vigna mungo TaxID=3915 RepID=A0AAQ3N5D3_VIGMU
MMEAHPKLILLNGENYHLWKGKMKDFLFVKNFHFPIFASNKLESKSDEECDFEHQQVYGFIRSLWDKLESLYASKSGTNKLYMLKTFVELKYKEGTPVSNHLSEFEGRYDQLAGVGINFDDDLLGLFLLNFLPNSWETFWVSMISVTTNDDISLQMENSGALNEEMRRKTHGTSSHSEGKSQKKEQNSGRDKSKSKSWSRYKNVECHYCHKTEHIKKNCFLWKKERKDKKGKQKERDNDDGERVTTNTCGDLVCLRDYDTINLVFDESMWIIDSGDTLHVTSRKEFFTSYTPSDFGILKMGNDVVSKVLDDDGYDNHFGSRKWKLTKGNLIMAKGEKNAKLYWTKTLVAKDSVKVVRLGHISEKGLNYLAKKDVLSGLKSVELEKCSHCMAGKQIRVSFKKHPPSRKSELLELVHSDVCGPLKGKDQVLDTFKEFHALVERQSGKKLKCIRTDNGGEYCGPFDAYCRQYSIAHEKTPPKTPQLNGLAERMNKTLIERVRCMLSKAKLPKHFWGKALLTAVHVINLSPAIALNCQTRFGLARMLLMIICMSSVDERSKLDVKTRQCIFIGFGQDEFGCKLYDPIEKKVVRSCDVQFMEDQTIEDIDKVDKSTPKQDDNVSINDLDINVHDDEQHSDTDNQNVGDGLDVPIDNVNEEEHDVSQDETHGDAKQPSKKYSTNEYVMLTVEGESECYEEATKSEEKNKWLDVMQDEMKSLHDNHTYDLVKLSKGKRALENRWIFRVKQESNSTSTRYKARLVVKGFRQRKGVDFNEIFSHMVRMTSIITVLSLDVTLDLEVEHMDVKTILRFLIKGALEEDVLRSGNFEDCSKLTKITEERISCCCSLSVTVFLHGDLEEEIYIKPPDGFLVEGKENYVCRLWKNLYGLKRAPRQWYKKFESVMCEQGYKKTISDHCVFIRKISENDFIILLLYVDDMLIDRLKKQLGESFAMKDMRVAKKILGIGITRDRKEKKL